jgi:hypothetical protein
MIFDNTWLFAHLIIAAIMARVVDYLWVRFKGELGKGQMAIAIVTGIAILFELFQWLILREPTSFLDSLGDVMAAFIMSIIVVL